MSQPASHRWRAFFKRQVQLSPHSKCMSAHGCPQSSSDLTFIAAVGPPLISDLGPELRGRFRQPICPCKGEAEPSQSGQLVVARMVDAERKKNHEITSTMITSAYRSRRQLMARGAHQYIKVVIVTPKNSNVSAKPACQPAKPSKQAHPHAGVRLHHQSKSPMT